MSSKVKSKPNPVFGWSFARIYPMYIDKVEKKGRTKAEVDEVIEWLLGYNAKHLKTELEKETTLDDFVMNAPRSNPNKKLITGVVCGVRVEDVKGPVLREVRYLDKLVDELAKGWGMEKIFRQK